MVCECENFPKLAEVNHIFPLKTRKDVIHLFAVTKIVAVSSKKQIVMSNVTEARPVKVSHFF